MFGFLKRKNTQDYNTSEANQNNKKKIGKAAALAHSFKHRAGQFSDFLSQKYDDVIAEFFTIKEKCQDLRQTNYDLGLYHLEKGHLSEAIFRFRLIRRVWPTYYDAYYQLAYCLALKEKYPAARKVLKQLIEKNPASKAIAQELLEKLNEIK